MLVISLLLEGSVLTVFVGMGGQLSKFSGVCGVWSRSADGRSRQAGGDGGGVNEGVESGDWIERLEPVDVVIRREIYH